MGKGKRRNRPAPPRRSKCPKTGRAMYSDRSTALLDVSRMTSWGMGAVHCPHCKHWHVQPKAPRKPVEPRKELRPTPPELRRMR